MSKKYQKTKNNSHKEIFVIISIIIVFLVGAYLFTPSRKSPISESQAVESSAGEGITIVKSDVTDKATFYSYTVEDTYMEVLAIKASDGTIRTALNTCQVCTGSGRAYYVQEGDVLVCQNCGNRFTVDQVEVIKGGCNPVPILGGDKTDDGESIRISDEFLANNKQLFYNWKN
ncbi:MAG: DUF2318 domain-containing protein [Eubacteriales bacterium]